MASEDAIDLMKNLHSSLPEKIGTLKFNCDKVDDSYLRFFSNVSINKLVLIGTNMNSHGLRYLSVSKIYEIDISVYNITDHDLEYLSSFDKVILRNAHIISDNGLKHLAYVRFVSLFDCPLITNRGIAYLTNVVRLMINYCPRITARGIILTNLELIDLTYFEFSNIKNEDLRYFSNVQDISLPNAFEITDKGARYLSRVKTIDFAFHIQVNSSIIRNLVECEVMAFMSSPRTYVLMAMINVKKIYFEFAPPICAMNYLSSKDIEVIHWGPY